MSQLSRILSHVSDLDSIQNQPFKNNYTGHTVSVLLSSQIENSYNILYFNTQCELLYIWNFT